MRRAHLIISGRVQGVGFRYRARDIAEGLGLKGWVRNLPDGRVETIAEGEDAPVEEFVKYCRKGPPGAHVSGVEISEKEPLNDLAGFDIEY